MMLEPGTKVKCINNIFMGKEIAPRYGTEGNIYIVVEDCEGPVFLLDINGNQVTVSKNRFLTLEDYRASQIEKLL